MRGAILRQEPFIRIHQGGGKHGKTEWRRNHGARLEGSGRRIHVRDRRLPGAADRARGAEGRHQVLRLPQRAGGFVCCRGRGLPDGPSGRLPRGVRPGRGARALRPRQREGKLLADDPDRRRVRREAQRHGRVPGRAPGADRDALLQVRARGGASPSHPVLRRNGRAQFHLRPPRRHVSRYAGRHHPGRGRRRKSPLSRSAAPSRRAARRRRRTSSRRSTC